MTMKTNGDEKLNDTALVDFFYEVGQLKRQPRAGWHLLGIKTPESVAEHTCRAVFMAYVLAKLEGANADKAALIAAFHELPETRIGDLHKMAVHYFPDKKNVERSVITEQLAPLPTEIAKGFHEFLDGEANDATPEHLIAKDADYLEVIMRAREYMVAGHVGAKNWADNASTCLKTASAKRLAAAIMKSEPSAWYERLKSIKR